MSTGQVPLKRAFEVFLARYLSKQNKFSIDIPYSKGKFFANRIVNALNNKEKILLYGDYDVDGMVSLQFMYEMIDNLAKVLGVDAIIDKHLPSRVEHYGLSYDYFQYLCQNNDLVITLDNGTHEGFFDKLTEEDNDKILILDHHPGRSVKEYKNTINPNEDGEVKISTGLLCEYMFQFLRKEYKAYAEAYPSNYFRDLTAITVLSDMADTNNPAIRKILHSGLERISKRERAIYDYLFPVFNGQEDRNITVDDIAFQFNPLLNSVSRMGQDINWIPTLIGIKENNKRFEKYMRKMTYINEIRKDASNHYTEQAEEILHQQINSNKDLNLAVIRIDDSPIGINGLIAGNVFQKYLYDTIVVSRNIQGDNIIMGSGRGEAIKAHVNKMLEMYPEAKECIEFGGHNAAIGLRVLEPLKFEETLQKYNSQKIEFPDLKNQHAVFNSDPITLKEYLELCSQYHSITNGVPLNNRIIIQVEAYITGTKQYRNNFLKIELGDDTGDKLSFVSKENSAIDYTSLQKQTLGLVVQPLKNTEDDVIFTEITPKKRLLPNKELQIQTTIIARGV